MNVRSNFYVVSEGPVNLAICLTEGDKIDREINTYSVILRIQEKGDDPKFGKTVMSFPTERHLDECF